MSIVNSSNALCAEFSIEIAVALYESEEQYPVDFELAWQWLGYTRKDSAKKKLVKNFVEGEDYTLRQTAERNKSAGFTHREDIWLTVNCLKEMGMMAGTPKGKEVRSYFLQCEAIAKQSVKAIPQLQQQFLQLQQQFETLQSQIQPLLPPHSTTPPPGWDLQVWATLQPQDKRHFRFLYRRRQFRPSNQSDQEPLALPALTEEIKQRQKSEVDHLVGEVSQEEKARVDAMKEALFARLDGEV
jgi:phage anti-repressor protein